MHLVSRHNSVLPPGALHLGTDADSERGDSMARTVTHVRYVDYGIGEYGFFGKTIAESNVTGMTAEEREREIAEVKALVGEHVQVIEVEAVPDA